MLGLYKTKVDSKKKIVEWDLKAILVLLYKATTLGAVISAACVCWDLWLMGADYRQGQLLTKVT